MTPKQELVAAELKRILRQHLATLNRSGSHDASKKSRSARGPSNSAFARSLAKLAGSKRPAETQFLGRGHEITQVT
jgi:hypothetical protein